MNLFNPTGRDIWQDTYKAIDRANYVYDIVPGFFEGNSGNSLRAECLFIRAFGHFHLMQFFALPYDNSTVDNLGVPIRTQGIKTIEQASVTVSRSTVQQVYTKIIEDLRASIPNLPVTRSPYFLNQWAGKALLARVYFQQQNYEQAFAQAQDVIQNSGYSLDRQDFVFLVDDNEGNRKKFRGFELSEVNSRLQVLVRSVDVKYADAELSAYNSSIVSTENIFSLYSPGTAVNRGASYTKSYRTNSNYTPQFQYNQALMSLLAETPSDKRYISWVGVQAGDNNDAGNYIPKFNYDFMHSPVLALNEMYFIAAEAAALKSTPNTELARQYLNLIQERADVPQTSFSLTILRLERRKELLAQGLRLGELKRLRSDNIRGLSWNDERLLFQIPDTESNGNPNIRPN